MPDAKLQIQSIPGTNDGILILALNGPLTLTNMFEFQSMVRSSEAEALIIDMTSVPYVDSAGIGCLVGAHVSHQNKTRRFALVGVNERVRTVLKVTGVENLLSIYSTVRHAEAGATEATGAA